MPPFHGVATAIGRRGRNALRRTVIVMNILHRSYAGISTNRYNMGDDSRQHARGDNAGGRLTHHHHRPISIINTHPTMQRCLSSAPPPLSSPFASKPEDTITTNLTEGDDPNNKSIFNKLWDKYSFEGQRKRIILGERLFRSAQYRASDPRWFQDARIPYEFRPRHALLTMHVWFLHKRLLADRVDSHLALLIQEELFDILWNDTRARIRAEAVNELTVNKHLKDAQQLTFLHCTHYDHAFQEFANDDKRRFEEIAGIVWTYVLNQDEEAYGDLVKRLSIYVEYQYVNLLEGVPDSYFWRGRIPWGDIPDFENMKDNNGKELEEMGDVPGLEVLPRPWRKTLTDAGETYYWNSETFQTKWKKPS